MRIMKKAIIYWISEEEGGRKRPPIGTEYYPTIQMENGDTWSLAIRFDRTNVEQNEFIIYEGPHKVGVMVIR